MPVLKYKDPSTGNWVALAGPGPTGPPGTNGSNGAQGPAGLGLVATNKNSAYTVANTDLVMADASAGNVPITVPAAPTVGFYFAVNLTNVSGSFNCTITLSGGDHFQVATPVTSVVLTARDDFLQAQYVGSNMWALIERRGVVAGGTTGQVLVKRSANDYDTGWSTLNTSNYANAQSTFNEKFAGMYVPKRALDRWQQAAKPWQTTLSAAMTNSQTTMTVTSLDGLPTPPTSGRYTIYIDSEQLFVTAGAGTTSWTVTRAVNNSNAATHAIGATVYGDSITRVVVAGDSTAESSIGGGGGTAGGGSGGDGWVTRMSRILSRISGIPLLSPQLGPGGFFGIWRNSDANIGGGAGNSAVDWTCPSGAWTLQATNTLNDRTPWGWLATANGSTNVLKLTVPPYMGSIRAVDVYYTEGATGPSYDINNSGTWTNIAGTSVQTNTIHRARVTSGSDITDFRLRAAASGGAATNPRILGVDLWPTAPTVTTTGLKVYNFGKDSDFLSTFNRTNTVGDNFALFDGDPGSLLPSLVIFGPFTNDVLFGGGGTYNGYMNNLTTCVNRVKPYADVIIATFSEQGGSRNVTDQATIRQRCQDVATATNCALLNMYDALSIGQGITGWAAADADGLHGTIHDVNHYGPLGHQEMAARFDRMITAF